VKIRRKDLRGPDEFETLTGETLVWARGHQTALIAGGVALLVLAIAGLLLSRARGTRNREAAAQFEQAQMEFARGNTASAAAQFGALEASAPGTPFGRLAGLYQGHALMQQGDAAGAATAYTEYLSTASAADYLRQQALLGLGRAKESAGDAPGALEAYAQAEKLDGPMRAEAALGTARLLEVQGKAEEAHAVYARLRKEAPEGWLRELVEAKTPSLGAGDAAADADVENVR